MYTAYQQSFQTANGLGFLQWFSNKDLKEMETLVATFLEERLQEYDNQMQIQLAVANSMVELRIGHTRAKTGLLALYKNKWNSKHYEIPAPSTIRETLTNKIEERFKYYQDELSYQLQNESIAARQQEGDDNDGGDDNDDDTPAIGIDLGTTMCCVMVYMKGKVEIIENRAQQNSRVTPSYIGFHQEGMSDTFGSVAKSQAYRYPETTAYDVKRMIGKPWSDHDLQKDRKNWPFEMVNENNSVKVKAFGRTRYPYEISAILLNKLRSMAETHLGLLPRTITRAVITVPAYFTEPQRKATRDAAHNAGLEVLNILSEPTAAAIAYYWKWKKNIPSKTILVYDLGGGTFDVAIARVSSDQVTILGVDGDTHLGGQDIDQLLVEYCVEEFKKKEGKNLKAGINDENKKVRDKIKRELSRLKDSCEKAKIQLSSCDESEVDIASILPNLDLLVPITKEKLEKLSRPLIQRTLSIVDKVIADAKQKGVGGKEDIEDVILIGGSTRMPMVITMLEEYFGKQAFQQINPDEAVAYGAAIQAAILTGRIADVCDFTVKDVTPFSLGIECANDATKVVIPRNSTIPCEHTQVFPTCEDNQTSIRLTCVQGEEKNASENKKLGEFYFYGIPASPARKEKLKVTMRIDKMGILNVKAVCLSTNNERGIKICAERI